MTNCYNMFHYLHVLLYHLTGNVLTVLVAEFDSKLDFLAHWSGWYEEGKLSHHLVHCNNISQYFYILCLNAVAKQREWKTKRMLLKRRRKAWFVLLCSSTMGTTFDIVFFHILINETWQDRSFQLFFASTHSLGTSSLAKRFGSLSQLQRKVLQVFQHNVFSR